MKRITTWHPDTCDCVLEYEWDDQHSEDVRKHIFTSVRHCGADHPVAQVGEQVEGSAFHTHHRAATRSAITREPDFTPEERAKIRKLMLA